MNDPAKNGPCDPRHCGCGPGDPDRREFLSLAGLGATGLVLSHLAAVAGPFEGKDFENLVPADKKLRPEWLKSLTARGEPTVCRGAELDHIGMPVGGIGAGQLYLGGDGKLWHWDVFNLPQPENFSSGAGPNYANPPAPASPLEQGFVLKVTAGDKGYTRLLDRRGFPDVAFRGQYPIGRVEYRDHDLPVSVALEAFSPFIPLNPDDSSLPATVMRFTVKNTGSGAVAVELAGWLENAVCLASGRAGTGRRRNRVLRDKGATLLHFTAEAEPKKEVTDKRPDVVFEDFEKATYEGWKVEGTAFGTGPVKRADVPAYQGDVGGRGERVVNSHAAAPGKDVAEKDAATGKLTSKPFTVSRRHVNFFIGGGRHTGKTCLNLVVGGKVVRTATGHNDNHMRPESFDVRDYEGQEAVIEIVDAETGSWGNVGVDHIVFSDEPATAVPLDRQPDFGSLALALLGPAEGTFALPGLPLDGTPAGSIFPPARAAAEAEAVEPFGRRVCGALGRTVTVKPGEQAEFVFVLAWHFPALPPHRFDALAGARDLRRSYGKRFDSAAAVVRHVATDFERLAGQTRLWQHTWHDSTLPHWFLDRTLLTVCCLATATCYHFDNGRFYGFEGTYCCDGTCTHVWHYAQAVTRLFPQLERATRELVDFGLAFHADSGAIDYRAEYGRQVAADGQAGTVLRAYREHQTSADGAFLRRVWPKVKKAVEYLMARDEGDGLLGGEQYNTLDASWYGQIAWISSLYLAAVRAAAAMAREMADEAFAKRCDAVNAAGQKRIVERLFNGEYFIQVVDPKHLKAINTNDGCHIDQVLGQSWAFQVGLPRVLPEGPTRKALESLWAYNFTPDVGPYRRRFTTIPGGRWYAMPGEGGLLMCTWPKGGADKAKGEGGNAGFVAYFNECMTGFEYQVAAHMLWEGLAEKGLAVTRMIHDRYHAARRNPWNEVECADHYARSMAGYGVFLAACGFEYHGPKGHIGFAPRLTPDDFRAPFTAAEGWGTFAQQRLPKEQRATIEVKWGQLRLRSVALAPPEKKEPRAVAVIVNGKAAEAKAALDGERLLVTLGAEVTLRAGERLTVTVG
jgi:uncharacterized protein (DUF608 family)